MKLLSGCLVFGLVKRSMSLQSYRSSEIRVEVGSRVEVGVAKPESMSAREGTIKGS